MDLQEKNEILGLERSLEQISVDQNTAIQLQMDAWKSELALHEARLKEEQGAVLRIKGNLQTLKRQQSEMRHHVSLHKRHIVVLRIERDDKGRFKGENNVEASVEASPSLELPAIKRQLRTPRTMNGYRVKPMQQRKVQTQRAKRLNQKKARAMAELSAATLAAAGGYKRRRGSFTVPDNITDYYQVVNPAKAQEARTEVKPGTRILPKRRRATIGVPREFDDLPSSPESLEGPVPSAPPVEPDVEASAARLRRYSKRQKNQHQDHLNAELDVLN